MKISPKIIVLLFFISLISMQNLNAEEKIKVGLLVPLSGNQSNIGKSILQSVRLAINKIDNSKIEILPKNRFLKLTYRFRHSPNFKCIKLL